MTPRHPLASVPTTFPTKSSSNSPAPRAASSSPKTPAISPPSRPAPSSWSAKPGGHPTPPPPNSPPLSTAGPQPTHTPAPGPTGFPPNSAERIGPPARLPRHRGVLKAFGGLAGGDEHGVPDRRERWGVGEVEAGHLFDRHLVPQGDGEGVDALAGVLATHDLGAEEPSGTTFDDQLRSHAAGAGEVVRPRRGLD